MAVIDSSRATLEQDLSSVFSTLYPLQALLSGALSLMEDYAGDDREGKIWSARELIELAGAKTAAMIAKEGEFHLFERIKALESMEVRHV